MLFECNFRLALCSCLSVLRNLIIIQKETRGHFLCETLLLGYAQVRFARVGRSHIKETQSLPITEIADKLYRLNYGLELSPRRQFERFVPRFDFYVTMYFQDYQGEVDPHVEHEIPGTEFRAHMTQLTQIQLAQIVSSAVCQALTQQM